MNYCTHRLTTFIPIFSNGNNNSFGCTRYLFRQKYVHVYMYCNLRGGYVCICTMPCVRKRWIHFFPFIVFTGILCMFGKSTHLDIFLFCAHFILPSVFFLAFVVLRPKSHIFFYAAYSGDSLRFINWNRYNRRVMPRLSMIRTAWIVKPSLLQKQSPHIGKAPNTQSGGWLMHTHKHTQKFRRNKLNWLLSSKL